MSTSLSSSHSSTVLPPACVQSHVSLASYTTFRVGGAAEWFCLPESADDLQMALQWAADVGLAKPFGGPPYSEGGVRGQTDVRLNASGRK
ncbi:MAG: hypothetical protein AAGE92_10175, partial [Cyanobacteria bacterium P01_G01_bin.4]